MGSLINVSGRGSFLDADTPAKGVKLARRNTLGSHPEFLLVLGNSRFETLRHIEAGHSWFVVPAAARRPTLPAQQVKRPSGRQHQTEQPTDHRSEEQTSELQSL